MTLTKICNQTIKYSFYLLFFLVPLILTPWNYELFEFNKMITVYFLTIIILGAWLIKMIAEGKIRIQRTPLDIPIIIYLITQLFSTIFSIDSHISIWGYYSRFHGGLLSTICYIILYYAFVTNFIENSKHEARNSKHLPAKACGFRRRQAGIQSTNNQNSKRFKIWNLKHSNLFRISDLGFRIYRLLLITLLSGFLVSLYGILEHFGIDKNIWVQDVQNRVFSTLGQPNWLAAYLCILLPIATALFLSPISPISQKKSSKKKERRAIPILSCSENLRLPNFTGLLRHLRKFSKSEAGWDNQSSEKSRSSVTLKMRYASLHQILFLLLSLIFYLTLLYTKSRSGFMAFWLSNLIFLIFIIFTTISLKSKKLDFTSKPTIVEKKVKRNQLFQPRKIYKKLLVLNLSFLLITFFIGSPFPQLNRYFSFSFLIQKTPSSTSSITPLAPALETGGTESGEIRKIVWKGAGDIACHFPLFGTGVETFAFAYYRFKSKEHNLTSEWDFLYNKAHNEYLNYAATTGFIGLGAYLLLIGSFIWWNLKKLKAQSSKLKTKLKSQNSKAFSFELDFALCTLHFALLAGYASILITNFFGFSVVTVALFFWLIPAISFVLSNSLKPQNSFKISLPTMKQLNNVTITIILFVFCYLFFVICKFWYADVLFARGNTLIQSSEHTTAYPYLQKAANLRPDEPLYHDKLSLNMANLATVAFLENEATLSADLITQALSHSQKAITISPQNLSFWKSRTRLFYSLSQIDENYLNQALKSLLIAKKLAPTDAKIYYNLALLYAEVNDIDQAIKILEETIDLKPNYRNAHYALALFYDDKGLKQKAVNELKYILEKINPNDQEIKEQLEEWE